MALTLPYPDMVFVPLDILTAEEQNQLVGNIEFLANQFPLSASNIANGAIGSDQLAAGAVKSNNVDFTTISGQTLSDLMTQCTASTISEGPYGTDIGLFRVGNIVIYSLYSAPTDPMPQTGTSVEAIPVGYRPKSISSAVLRGTTVGEWRVNPNGTAYWWNDQAIGNRIIVTLLVYLTEDDFPS